MFMTVLKNKPLTRGDGSMKGFSSLRFNVAITVCSLAYSNTFDLPQFWCSCDSLWPWSYLSSCLQGDHVSREQAKVPLHLLQWCYFHSCNRQWAEGEVKVWACLQPGCHLYRMPIQKWGFAIFGKHVCIPPPSLFLSQLSSPPLDTANGILITA